MKAVTVRRWEVVTAFVVLTVVFVVGLLWVQHIAATNHKLIVAQRHLSNQRIKDRRIADRKICRAVNQGRAINNRDRALLIDSLRSTRAAIPKATGFLRALLEKSARSTREQIKVRPYLPPIKCAQITGGQKRIGLTGSYSTGR